MFIGRRCRRVLAAVLLWLVVPAATASAIEFGPQGVVRQFCEADALGYRVTVSGWQRVAPLVEWSLEPAWDEVMLIAGYSVGPPRPDENGALAVDVSYSIVGQLTARGLNTESRIESLTFRVHAPDERGWRLIGPPPPPHLFGARVDVAAMRRSLDHGGPNFLPNSAFVWQMYRRAGWNVGLDRAQELLSSAAYRAVEEPMVGDLVAYLRDETPYHVGILATRDQVVSSTLNYGIVRAAIGAFAGEVRYLRLVDPGPRILQVDEVLKLAQVPAPHKAVRRATGETPRARVGAPPTPKAPPAQPTPTVARRKAQPSRPARR